MNAKQIFDEMIARSEKLERMINETVEGNTGDNRHVYNKESREAMQKELDALQKAMEVLDNLL